MPDIKQSSAGTPITFFMVSATDHLTGAGGLTPSVTISKNGGSYAAPAGAIVDNGNGWYKIAGNATDCNTLGPIDLHATDPSLTADPCDMKDAANIVAYDPGSSTNLGLTNLDTTVSSRMATFTLPTNFNLLSIDANGRVDLSKWLGATVNALITGRVDSNAQVIGDKTGYSLSQAFPTNFSSLAIDVSGRVDLGKWIGVAPAALTTSGYVQGTLLRWLTDNAAGTPNALISGRIDSNAQVVGDKTGYTLSQAFPTNFSTLSIDASGRIDLGKWIGSIPNALISGRVDVNVGINSDKTGYTLSSAGIQAIFDFATSLLTTVGSIGKLLVTNLDATISSRSVLDQAGVRTATGLASANLDTQFTAIPDAILDKANGVETGWTLRQLFRLWLAGICGPRASFGTAAPTVSNPASTKTRLTGAGIDVNGNGTWSTDVT